MSLDFCVQGALLSTVLAGTRPLGYGISASQALTLSFGSSFNRGLQLVRLPISSYNFGVLIPCSY